MKKRILSIAMALALCLGLMAVPASAAGSTSLKDEEGNTYEFSNPVIKAVNETFWEGSRTGTVYYVPAGTTVRLVRIDPKPDDVEDWVWDMVSIEVWGAVGSSLNPCTVGEEFMDEPGMIHYLWFRAVEGETPAVPTTNGGSTVSSWAVGNINNAEAAGLVPQWLMGTDLTKSISRGDFAAAAVGLYRAMGGSTDGVSKDNPFTDVDSSLKSYEDILLAKALGIANGKGGDRFDPNGTLTREEAAVMLCNVYKALGKSIPTVSATAFADDGSVSSWAKSAVAFMNQRGVVSGKGENKYDPQGLNAAEEALTMALNMLNKLK